MAASHSPVRALTRPTALLSHVLVLAVVAGLVTLGQWQLDRLDDRREVNARFEARASSAPLAADELFALGEPDEDLLEFRRVQLTGTYLPDEEVLLEGRSLDGQAGRHSFLPLELDEGPLVLVRRGWVPRGVGDPPVADAAPPEGSVTVDGFLERSVEPEGSFTPRNPASGELEIIQLPEVDRIAEQLPGDTYPMFVTLVGQEPPPIASPAVDDLGLDALPIARAATFDDEGSHLNYAIQWHSFALLALVAYGAWWTKRLREWRDGPDDEGVAPDARSDAPTPSGTTV